MGYIEKIKLKDFKSFKNAVIPLLDGFVCVVGPNGSGKSNIVDAIIFALGEGSMKALRAGRVKDLVHHSSRSGTAGVTVELRNGNEKLAITREIDKQGNSIYKLNGKRSTRAEIQEVISSMGIPPEGYNIIMQGDVSSFIKMTPLQRRTILDEIAGVSEYEEKKEKAISELDKVESKIKEAEILLYEKKGYIAELKKERDEALRYQRYSERRDLIKANILKKELDKLEKAFSEKAALLEEKRQEFESRKQKYSEIEAEIRGLQKKLDSVNKEIISRGEKEQLAIGKEIEATRSEIKFLQNSYSDKSKRISSISNEVLALKKELSRLQLEKEKKESSLVKLGEEISILEKKIDARQREIVGYKSEMESKNLLVSEIAKELDDFSGKIRNKQEEYYKLLSEINAMKERISVLRLNMDRLSSKKETDERTKQIEERVKSLRKELASYKKLLLDKEAQMQEAFEIEKELNTLYSKLEARIDQMKEKYHSIQSRITTIRSITGNEASEAVLEASKSGKIPGIIGKVDDLCEYPGEYATAVQTAAGPRLNFIVTEDDSSATSAVKWLRSKRIGRTTFIPLNKIRSMSVPKDAESFLKQPGVIGFAIDLVKFDPKLRRAFEYVFGDTLIVDTIETARSIGFGKVRMATLEGDLIESSGAVTGGYRRGTVTLKELKEKEELKSEIEKALKERDKILGKLEEIRRRMDEIRKAKGELELKVKEKEIHLSQTENKIKEYLEERSAIELERERLAKDISELETEIRMKEKETSQVKTELGRLERERSQLKSKLESPEAKRASAKLGKLEKGLESLRSQKTELDVQYKSLKSELENVVSSRIRDLDHRIASMTSEMGNLKNELGSIKKKIFALEGELSEMLEKEREISTELSALINEREEIQKRIQSLAEKRGGLQRIIENVRSEFNQIDLEKARLETRLIDVKSEWEKVDKGTYRDLDMDVEELKKQLDELSKKMARLEPVNMRAIQMYEKAMLDLKDVEEKAEKLKSEKEAVLELIKQIENRKKEAFMGAFFEVKKHFQQIYRQFYPDGGDKTFADMRLENEDDPFSGGLIVEARPAGKPIKRIEALSGGEQAVVALTFLFAVQAYKPSPFYVLDEADAPLDRANSERLARLLKERSKNSQFIVVTHNASLLHQTDQMIGVSMDKKIGSSVVEVNMKEYSPSG